MELNIYKVLGENQSYYVFQDDSCFKSNCIGMTILWNTSNLLLLMLIYWLVKLSTLVIRMSIRYPRNMIFPYHTCSTFMINFGTVSSLYTYVALLITEILLVRTLEISIICTLSKVILTSTRLASFWVVMSTGSILVMLKQNLAPP